ncbi:MAG: hypothetical protein ACRCX8_18915 [Sarcina sp.]
MIISKTVMVRWNNFTRQWYEGKGYTHTKQGDLFECKIEDVQLSSTVKVKCKCDYCEEEYETEYRRCLKSLEKVRKACCSNRQCMVAKSREISILKYGVDNHMKTEKSKKAFSENNRAPFKEILKIMTEKGLQLISEEKEYKNKHSRLKYVCKKHQYAGVQESTVMDIKRNKYCCAYGGQEVTVDTKRMSGVKVYDDFVRKGFVPQFKPEDYKNNSELLPYICPKHKESGVQHRTYALLNVSKGCPECKKENLRTLYQRDEGEVFGYFNKRGLLVENGEKYINKETYIHFRCIKHKDILQKITLANLKRVNEPCECCREENRLNSIYLRIRNCLSAWKKDSKDILGDKCIFTKTSINIAIHHQIQFVTILKDTLREENIEIKDDYTGNEFIKIRKKVKEKHSKTFLGVPLNEKLHNLFHIEYGKKMSNRENFAEFIQRYSEGEFDNRLDEELKSINNPVDVEEVIRKTGMKLNEIEKFKEVI